MHKKYEIIWCILYKNEEIEHFYIDIYLDNAIMVS